MTSDAKDNGTLLEIDRVTKQFGSVLAVDEVSLSIKKGELFALLGGSGSGKTTLLRILAGFEQPSTGRVILDGQDITELPPHKRPINMMFQSYALFPHMNVEQNIAFGLKREGLPRQEIAQRVRDLLALVQMQDFAKRKPKQLSGGQQQRVALARSLAKRPKLLLLDEPMAALDKKLRSRMQLELVEILEQVGVTCVMVTHDQEEAMTMASRIAIMNGGWIQQVGAPRDIYETPNSIMSAEFIGLINLYQGQIIVDENDHCTIESSDLGQHIHIGHGITTSLEDSRVWVAVRPEKTYLSLEKPDQTYNWAEGIVDDIEYLGAHSIFHIKLKSGRLVRAHRINFERTNEVISWETKVYISWDDQNAIVLQS